MSKSKGNIIDPLELIDKYGADPLRFTLASLAAQGKDIKLSEENVKLNRNFITKIWNSYNFLEINGCIIKNSFKVEKLEMDVNVWVVNFIGIVLVLWMHMIFIQSGMSFWSTHWYVVVQELFYRCL